MTTKIKLLTDDGLNYTEAGLAFEEETLNIKLQDLPAYLTSNNIDIRDAEVCLHRVCSDLMLQLRLDLRAKV